MARDAKRPPVLFLHTGWARDYQGSRSDPPQGKFGYISRRDGPAGEAANFRDFRGRCYGYAPRQRLDIRRLGAPRGATSVTGVLVVFTATNPDGSGRYIVGWYDEATVHSEMQDTRLGTARPHFIAECAAAKAYLVPIDQRTFAIPAMTAGWPGVASAFYASEILTAFDLRRIFAYVAARGSAGVAIASRKGTSGGGAPRQADPELRAKVEAGAVRSVWDHYEKLGYDVTSVEDQNLGWDLEAIAGTRELLIEVKGRSGTGAVELTPNEWNAMNAHKTRMRYRLAVVHDALNADSRPVIFDYRPGDGNWLSEQGQLLVLKEMTGAVATF